MLEWKQTLTALFVIIGLCSSVSHAQKQPACSSSDLQGGYGFTVTGTNVSLEARFAISGWFSSEGKSALTGNAVQSVNGKIVHAAFSGTYKVAPDCTGSASLDFDNGVSANICFTIVCNGNEILMIVSDAGTVETGIAKKQRLVPIR